MQFNPATIKNRDLYLDKVLEQPQLIQLALDKLNISGNFTSAARVWTPGGGSSLFNITTNDGKKYFMKVKHSAVTVESKLETEPKFILLSALQNEYKFLQKYQDSPYIPKLVGYTELSDYDFLVTEALINFDDGIKQSSPEETVEYYQQIESFVRAIFENGDIHTDLHEKNIMFRDKTPVIIDWEEARHLPQTTDFTNSLDVKGANYLGNIGQTPKSPGMLPGHTSLNRLKLVFNNVLSDKIQPLLSLIAYNAESGICTSLNHGQDSRSYQSINLGQLKWTGQRPGNDWRIRVIKQIILTIWNKTNLTYVDIGSNIGNFTRSVGKLANVRMSIGIEGAPNYNRIARLLAFIDNSSNNQYFDLICGENDLTQPLAKYNDIVYGMLSVYHHIKNQAKFLSDLCATNPIGLIVELPTQPECYPNSSWRHEIAKLSNQLTLPYHRVISYTPDYRRPLVILSNTPYSTKQKLILSFIGIVMGLIALGYKLTRLFRL